MVDTLLSFRANDEAPEDVEPACRKSLKDLKLEYLDLYLIHQAAALRKDAPTDDVSKITEEQKLGYCPKRMAKTWEVCGGREVGGRCVWDVFWRK